MAVQRTGVCHLRHQAGETVCGGSRGEWPHYFQSIRLPQTMYRSFLCMLEYYNIIVSLDFTKDTYMVPSLLPDTPPPNYPTYDLSSNLGDVIVQYLEVNFLPPPLFPQLIACVLLYIRQISAQLLSTSMEPEREGLGAGSIQSNRSSMISKLSMYRSESYHLDQLGYLSHDDLNMAGHDEFASTSSGTRVCSVSFPVVLSSGWNLVPVPSPL